MKAQIWGNIISSTILKPVLIDSNNSTNMSNLSTELNLKFCGALDCPGSSNTPQIKSPLMSTVKKNQLFPFGADYLNTQTKFIIFY